MIRNLIVLLPLFSFILACGPEKPQITEKSQNIVYLQTLKTIGPQIIGTRPLRSPRKAVANQMGEIYIADYGNDRIVKLDSAGTFLDEAGGFGKGDYALSGPLDLAIDQVSNIYVVDSGNRRVVRLDRYLNFISSENGFSNGQDVAFIRPTCIDITDRGDILIGDEGLGACYKLDAFFTYVFEFGGRDEIQPLMFPSSISYDNKNFKIYVADSDAAHIAVYDDFGLLLRVFGDELLEKPTSVTVSPSRNIWVGDEQTGLIYSFNQRGQEIFRWNGSGESLLVSPAGLFADNNENLYIADSQTSRIYITRPVSGN
jgi:sugar lactone lactonase YvrE